MISAVADDPGEILSMLIGEVTMSASQIDGALQDGR